MLHVHPCPLLWSSVGNIYIGSSLVLWLFSWRHCAQNTGCVELFLKGFKCSRLVSTEFIRVSTKNPNYLFSNSMCCPMRLTVCYDSLGLTFSRECARCKEDFVGCTQSLRVCAFRLVAATTKESFWHNWIIWHLIFWYSIVHILPCYCSCVWLESDSWKISKRTT